MSTSAEVDNTLRLAIFDRFPFPAVVVERGTTRLLRANRAAAELLHIELVPVPDGPGPTLADLVTRPLAELDDDLRIAAGGADLPLVLPPGPDSDEPRRYGCQVVPIELGPGPITLWLVTFGCNLARLNRFQDMSGQLRRANEEAAEERKLRARTSVELRTLERFAQAMAHDLKGPLRHIGTLLPAIEDSIGTDLPPESRRLLELARMSAQRGRDLVEALLGHATAVSGEVELEPVDLDRLVEASLVDHQWALDGVPHRISLVEPLGAVDGDRALVRLLIDNLIGNAIKYRNPDRILEIDITRGSDRSPSILEVADNGIGFEPGDAIRVFEPFVRLESSIDGHGIGLATCQTICDRHGWVIDAIGQRHRGARFRVRAI